VWFGGMHLLLFSDVSNNRIMSWNEQTGEVGVFRKPANYANGNTRDRQGRLLTCEHQTRWVTRTEHDGTITVILDQFEGKPLNSPNDIVCKSDGSIWFTDPAFGPNPYESMAKPELPSNVYRVDPNTKQATVVVRDAKGPNGLCFSPDETKLYLIEARATPNRLIRVYDVVEGGPSSPTIGFSMTAGRAPRTGSAHGRPSPLTDRGPDDRWRGHPGRSGALGGFGLALRVFRSRRSRRLPGRGTLRAGADLAGHLRLPHPPGRLGCAAALRPGILIRESRKPASVGADGQPVTSACTSTEGGSAGAGRVGEAE